MKDINRSLLFVPAVEEKVNKIPFLKADAYIIDLEDSIKPEKKQDALETLIDRLADNIFADATIIVRLNKDRLKHEIGMIETMCGDKVTGYMVPKVESESDVQCISRIDKEIIALVETPFGVMNLREIASCDSVNAIAFGAEDYCAETGCLNSNEYLIPIKTTVVQCARAFNKLCYDTISKELEKSDELVKNVMTSRFIGFDGKLAIHPCQVVEINNQFSLTNPQKSAEIVNAFEESDDGVLVFEGKVYERPHIEKYKKELTNESK